MKKNLSILLFLVTVFSALSQENEKLKILLNHLDLETTDAGKSKILNSIIEIVPNGSNKKIDYLLQAENLAIAQKNFKDLNFIYHKIIGWYGVKGNFDMLFYYAIKLQTNAEKTKDYEGIIRSQLFIAQTLVQNNNQAEKAKIYINNAEKIIFKHRIFNYYSSVNIYRGFIEYYKGNYEKAISFYLIAIKSAEKHNNADLPSYYLEVGLAYTQWQKPEKAFYYFDLAEKLYKKKPLASQDEMVYLYSDIGLTYASIKNYPKAIEAFNKSMALAQKIKDVKTQMENYNYLAKMYSSLNDYKAENENLKKYYHLKDSLFTSDKNLKQAELLADFEIEKKNTLVTQKELENTKNKNQRNIFIGIALATLLSLGLLLFFYKRVQNKNKLISNQKTSLEELNTVKDRLFAILSHDLRNPLVTLKSFLTLSANKNLSPEKIEKYQLQTNQTLTQTTNLLDSLLLWANSQLQNTKYNTVLFDLESSILEILESVKPQANFKNIDFKTNLSVKKAISNSQIIELSIRNILTNAIKFSNENSQIRIETYQENSNIKIKIQDFGNGMSEQQINEILSLKSKSTFGTNNEKGSGLGLFLVQEMLAKVDGKLKIESQLNLGSTFILEI